MNKQKFDQFEAIFHPKSIAVVGVTRKRESGVKILFRNIHRSGFQGKVYPVNPSGEEILGVKSYPRVSDIPEPVDYVIMGVPPKSILEVIDDCTVCGVKTISVFSAGYSEAGTQEGRRLEEELVQKANESGIRVIGPNCLGIIYNSSIKLESVEMGLTYNRTGEIGPVGIIAQSGGVAFRTTGTGLAQGIQFSKVISYGNGPDLDSTDFLEYFAADPDTQIIGLYIEGVRDGRRLLELLRQVCKTKPVVIWKGGRTEAGVEVTASHTGSLAASYSVWSALSKQVGCVQVENQNELVDTLLGFYCLGEFKGRSIGFITGFSDGGGSDSVSATDIFSSLGFEIPPFSAATRSYLQNSLPSAGTILRNPLDGGVYAVTSGVLDKVLTILADDPGVDLIIIQEYLYELLSEMPRELVQSMNDIFIQLKKKLPKPIVVISAPGYPTTSEQWEIERRLVAAGIPVFPNLERAAKAIANMTKYFKSRELDENH